ncbi:MAG: molybdopterin-dependent oxidoreductase [Acidobacteria bacterium]|nr:molybdopterin-dependent oxidoreductase [Acidobacteriota bacterium]
MPELAFKLNGLPTLASYEEGMHLLDVLREACGITSVKDGCSPQGFCGCCTILLDDRPALACLLEPSRVEGREVVTLEGLPEAKRRILARAFLQEGAVQCGFCTPGIAVRAAALMKRGLTTDPDRVRRALRGHLCRCTGYHRIVDAIQVAGEAWAAGEEFGDGSTKRHGYFGERLGRRRGPDAARAVRPAGVGDDAPRMDGVEQVLGTKTFVADVTMPGMLHAAVALAQHPRAEIVHIDTSRAEALPGVVRVLTASDVPGQRSVGLIVHDWPLLVAVGETTRCVGDVLAVVVADTQHRARAAAGRVRVEYRVLEPVTDPEEALAPGAPRIHPSGNLLDVSAYARGDVESALADSVHVIDETFTTQRIEHAFLEPEACLAIPRDGGLRVLSQGQGVHDDQRQITAILGLELKDVEVELVTNGGAFGGKEDLSIQGHAALAAHLLGRPVRLVLTREQSIRLHPKRHPMTMHYTVGADADGRLTALRARIVGDTGAYASVGAKVLERAAGHACGPYRVPNVDVEARAVYTNNPPCGAMRGFGVNQTAFAIEGVMDRLADRVGVDGWEIRSRNVLRPGDRFGTGQRMSSSCGIAATLEAVREVYRDSGRAGIACGIKNTGIGNGMADIGRVLLRVDNGRLEALTGFTEMGQGLHTVIRQVVCHETGLAPDLIRVRTISHPAVECGMTTASRATALSTVAAQRAARALAEAMNGGELSGLEGREFIGEYVCDFTVAPGTEVEDPVTHLTFGYATQVVILGDDGRIERIVAVHDVGRAVNPQQCAGQVEGGVHMGLGYALSEELRCEGGRPVSLRLADLGIVPADRMPPVEVVLLEIPDEVGGYGSKGVGEIGLVPTAGAVASALHARDGVWATSLPLRVDDLLPDPRRARRPASPEASG